SYEISFFFSSRRRHTRSKRDWSSDVCSSDLPITDKVEERTYGDSRTFYPMPGIGPKTWFLYKEAYDMDMFKVVDLIATIQKHVHQGISFTLFVKDDVDTRKLS